MVRAALAAAVLLFVSGIATAEDARDPLLNKMTGQWLITGTILGRQVTHAYEGEWVIQNKYLRFHEVSVATTPGGSPEYEAIVFVGFDRPNDRYVCFWFDNTGVAGPGSGGVALRAGNALPFVFKSPQGEFHNTMTYDAESDVWRWAMDSVDGGKTEPFARLTLLRGQPHRK